MINFIELGGVKYPIDTSFKTAILCDKINNDPDIDDYDRPIIIVTLLLGIEAPYTQEALDKCKLYLEGGDELEGDEKRILDFTQHWDYFVGAFYQAYGLNLNEVDLHYYEFLSLLRSLKNTALNDIVELLTYDLSEIKDKKTRDKIIKAQKKFKIKQVVKRPQEESAFLKSLSPSVKGVK